jgi:hypothetical protein
MTKILACCLLCYHLANFLPTLTISRCAARGRLDMTYMNEASLFSYRYSSLNIFFVSYIQVVWAAKAQEMGKLNKTQNSPIFRDRMR